MKAWGRLSKRVTSNGARRAYGQSQCSCDNPESHSAFSRSVKHYGAGRLSRPAPPATPPGPPAMGREMASVAVFARSPLFRAGLAALLSTMGFAPVLAVSGLDELKSEADKAAPPEMILLSLSEDGEQLSTLIRELRTWMPAARIVCLAQTLDIQELSYCFAAGASGYLLQEISRSGLEHSLRLVNAGEKVFPSALASALLPSGAKHSSPGKTMDELRKLHLTDLEIEILRYMASGDFNGAIAKKSGLSDAEVRTRVRVVLRKLHLSNRTQAALWAFARGLAEPFAALPQPAEEGSDSNERQEPLRTVKKPNG